MSNKKMIGLTLGLLLTAAAEASTVYISDVQFVAIREGMDNATRAVERGLKSGTPLQVLEQSQGYTKVLTPSGNEGWVADYFLSEDMVTRDQLDQLQQELNKRKQDVTLISNDLSRSNQKISDLENANATLQQRNNALEAQLQEASQLSQRAQAIVANNDNVSYQLTSLKQQADAAKQYAENLQDTTQQKWFILGAATLFGGLLLGTILPMLRRKKTSSGRWS